MQSEYRILEDKRGEMKVTFTKEEFQSIMNEVYVRMHDILMFPVSSGQGTDRCCTSHVW